MQIVHVNPPALGKKHGMYSTLTRVHGATDLIFIAGTTSTDADGNIVGLNDFDKQCVCTYERVRESLAAVGADFSNVVQFVTHLINVADIPKFMAFREREYPRMFPNGKYPPNTFTVVSALIRPEMLIEVATTAVL